MRIYNTFVMGYPYSLMDDLAKIGISSLSGALCGFIGGVLVEPIKLHFQEQYKIKRLRDAILREIATNYIHLREFLEAVETEPSVNAFLPDLSVTLYEQAQTEVFLFSQVEPAHWIRRVYGGFYYVMAMIVKTAPLSDEAAKEYVWKSKAACKQIEDFAEFPGRLFMGYIPRRYRGRFRFYG